MNGTSAWVRRPRVVSIGCAQIVHSWRVRSLRVVLLSVVLMVTAACSSKSPSNQGTREAEHRYAVLRDDAWRLREAVDPLTDDGVSSAERPALDWYAEYVPKNSSSGGTVRLSGHRATFHRTRSSLGSSASTSMKWTSTTGLA